MKTPPDLLELDLTRHCVETEVRRRYERAVRAYFRKPAGRRDLEFTIELLSQALETLDFGALRARYPALAGGTPSRIVIARDQQARPVIFIDDQLLEDLPVK